MPKEIIPGMQTHIIKVKWLGPTEQLGARVKLTSGRFGDSVTMPYEYVFNGALEVAKNWLSQRLGPDAIVTYGEYLDCDFIAIEDFKSLVEIESIKPNKGLTNG